MSRRYTAQLSPPAEEIDVVTTDVFDTMLLRNSRSERSRIMLGERLFSELLATRGRIIGKDSLMDARLSAQRVAFQALARQQTPGEVQLGNIVKRQLCLLGLPVTFTVDRLRIEVEVEKQSLVANLALGHVLREHRRAGRRIAAVSDTTLATAQLRQLVEHFHGSDLVDDIHGSADHGLTKRNGHLFDAVARAEKTAPDRMLHMGDDAHADVRIPRAKGIHVQHLPREAYRTWLRSINGAVTEVGRKMRRRARVSATRSFPAQDPISFGRYVFGPIVVQFCMRIWLYAAEAEATPDAVLMFCARGGIGIREAFERTLQKLGLPLGLRRENLMISRLIAARAALLAHGPSALEELDREFRGSTMADVARALGGGEYDLAADWGVPFHAEAFVRRLFQADSQVLADIRRQNELFSRHFRQLIGEARRIILCDTGLYGSTQRLLAEGFPNLQIETVQFARSNYKGHGEEHFPRVTGLMVEQNFYSPLNVYSCVLRYWHIIESLFEPSVPSARVFSETDAGQVLGNCGDIRFGIIDPSANNSLLTGTLAYIEHLPEAGGGAALGDADAAWRRLERAIARPTSADLRCLEVSDRSVDFGRAEVRQIISDPQRKSIKERITSIRAQLWREGAITKQFPILKYAFLPLFEVALSMRALLVRRN